MDAPRKSPSFYESLFALSDYIDRDYAPLDQRAERLVAHEEAALAEIAHVRENLSPPLSRPVAEVAARNFAGFATYLRGDVAKLDRPRGRRRAEAAVREGQRGARQGGRRARPRGSRRRPREATRAMSSAPVRYAKLLRVQEGLTPAARGLRAHERGQPRPANKKAYEELAPRVKPRPVAEAAALRDRQAA